MVTAISKANFETACGTCYDYILAQDWANAWIYYAGAEAQLSGLEVQGGQGSAFYRLRESLNGLRKALETAQSGVNKINQGTRLVKTKTKFLG